MTAKKRAKKKVSKKKKPGKAVARRASSEVGATGTWKDRLAEMAKQESERRTSIGGGGNQIRVEKDGSFKFQGEEIGDEEGGLSVIVVAFVRRKNWYDRPFDRDNPSPPACFAISPDGIGMVPHDTSPVPQADSCDECWADEFGSDNRGRGKACRDAYLLACVTPDDLQNEDAPTIALLSVPPTSLAAWDSYMVKRNKVLGLPSLAFLTYVTTELDGDTMKLIFDEEEQTPEEFFEQLFDLRDTAMEILMEPPDVSQYEPPGKKKAKKKSKKKVAKKKAAKKKSKRKTKKKSGSRF